MGKGKGKGKRPLSSAPKKAEPKINPFERKVVRPKFSVLGRNLKETEKTAGQSRQVATESRKNTLLKEFQQLGKANKFVDQRIGEKDKSLSREDKLLQRFQKERQARFKKSDVFNLEEEELTHMGTSLSKMDDFSEDFHDSSDDEDKGHLNAEVVSALHFGGGEPDRQDDDGKKKTKREIMSELIAKSKFFKAERQKEKLANEELTDKLDDAWRGLLKQGAFAGMVRNNKKEDPVEMLMKSLERAKKGEKGLEAATTAAEAFDGMEEDKKDDFNMLFRELAFEMKGRATDRLKTPEEIAKEEKERLEQLERERLRRMQGDVSSEDEEEEEEDEEEEGEEDEEGEEGEDGEEGEPDLDEEDEDEDDDDEEAEVENAKEAEGDEDEENADEDEDEDDEGDMELAEEGASKGTKRKAADEEDYFLEPQLDDDLGGASEEDDEDEDGEDNKKKRKKKASALPVFGQNIEDLPFTFEMPEDHKAFLHIVKGRDSTQLDVVIHRIRVCHDLALSPDNRAKMERLVGILYDHFAYVGKTERVDMAAADVLTKHLFQLAQAMPDPSARAARERLVAIQQALHTRLTTVQLSGRKGAWPWPGVEDLLFLKLVSVIFPTTDFQHTVTTPAILFLGQVLAQCPLSNPLHAVAGLFVAQLTLHYLQGTGRFVPEAMFFLTDLLSFALLCNLPSSSALENAASSFVRETSSEPFLRLGAPSAKRPNKKARTSASDENGSDSATDVIPPINFLDIFSKSPTDPYFAQDTYKLQVLQTSVRLLSQFSTHCFQNGELQSYPEIFFTPYSVVSKLLRARAKAVPAGERLQALLQEAKTKLGTSIKRRIEQRMPLRQRRKPVPIRMLNPRFKENFKVGKDNDPDRERAEKKKFERMYKKELKGAMRELRKDTAFLQTEREKKKREDTLERLEKTKRVMNILATQEGDIKKMERLKKTTSANSSSVL